MQENIQESSATPSILIKREIDEVSWEIHDPEVADILNETPRDRLPEDFATWVKIACRVLHSFSLQPRDETLKSYFGIIKEDLQGEVDSIAKLAAKLEKEILDDLPNTVKSQIEAGMKIGLKDLSSAVSALDVVRHTIPDTVKGSLGEHTGKLEEIANSIKVVTEALSKFVGKYQGSKERGEVGESFVYKTYVDSFKDDLFEDVSTQKNYSDIKAQAVDIVPILIEVKHYTTAVPVEQVRRFRRDLKDRGIQVGCFLSLGTSIQGGVGDYRIESNGNELSVFMNAAAFMGQDGMEDGVRFAYFITRKFAQFLKGMEREKLEEGILKKKMDDTHTTMHVLKAGLQKLREVRDKMAQIEKLAAESIASVEQLYRDAINKIDKILNV